MTAKQILDSFSETLMQDERIMSAQERSLLATLLQHAKAANGRTPEMQQAVRAVVASAVGETVAQRAFSVLGGSIVEKILQSGAGSSAVSANLPNVETLRDEPQPPRPDGPGVKAPPKAPHAPMKDPGPPLSPIDPMAPVEPQPPRATPPPARQPHKAPHGPMRDPGPPSPISPMEPQPPRPSPPSPISPSQLEPSHRVVSTTVMPETSLAVEARPSVLPARCVILDEFLAPQELTQLIDFTLERETDFQASEVVSPEVEGGVINYEHRRSRVLMDLGPQQELILERIKQVLPQVLDRLGLEKFSIERVEAQITASNDGDFFHFHSDSGSGPVSSRYLTFVYFFHREPAQFEGGELRIHDAQLEDGIYASQGSFQTIVPRQNQIVFFPCELMHEITPVKCRSGLFADSRFTLNGWFRR
jgi:Rps23 Pro-64 3,4-dihydroxylase Tpa1-like proline 4-hydroxylase